MNAIGHIEKGVVVFDEGATMPEGIRVYVTSLPSEATVIAEPGKLPLVRTLSEGTLDLSNSDIQRILDEEEIDALQTESDVSA